MTTAEGTPLWQRLSDAADVLAEVVHAEGFCEVTPSMAKAAHQAASRMQQEAIEAAERDQLIDDLGKFFYEEVLMPGSGSLGPGHGWDSLSVDSLARRANRRRAELLLGSFDVRRIVEVPF